MDLIDTVRDVTFEFGIGDPTFVGWFTVLAYLVAAVLAAANAWRALGTVDRTRRRLWATLTVLLVLLAINKQLDVQSYFTAVGRAVAREQGWYEARGSVQLIFVLAVAVVVLAAIALITWTLRDVLREQRLTLAGIAALLGFVLIRASSFHYVDALIGLEVFGIRMNWVFELGAIAILGVAAAAQLRRPPEPVNGDGVGPAPLDQRVALAALGLIGVGFVAVVALLVMADQRSPATHLEPERKEYAGPTPTYELPSSSTRFREAFSGSPTSPTPWPERSMDITVHSRDFDTARRLDEMDAAFGVGCEPPPATHPISAYEDAVFQCGDQLVTAINATGFGAIYLTPDHLLDFENGGTVRWQMSTERTSSRDWVAVWISPYGEHLQLPLLEWQSNLSGPPRNGLLLEMSRDGNFIGHQFVDHQGVELAAASFDGPASVLDPSRTTLTTFEIELSPTRIRMGLPDHGLWWIESELPTELEWSRAVVQFAHLTVDPTKDCDGAAGCGPNSWHWDDVTLEPAVPFTILQGDQSYIDISRTPEVTFDQPASDDAHLRFWGMGQNVEVSVDGGFTWEPAQRQTRAEGGDGDFESFWHPVPAGTWYVRFRADNESDWYLRDVSIWSPYVAAP